MHRQTAPGREAVLVGALAHSRREDAIVAAEDSFLAGFLRGDSLHSRLALLFSNISASAPIPEMVSPGQFALIRGMGKAKELLDSGKVALVFCGEDPSALAFQNEALALAAKHKAPVVCLIETNLSTMADHEGRCARSAKSKGKKTPQQQFPEIVVEGADVVAIFRVAQEAVRRARTGHGPSLIKCVIPEEISAQAQGETNAGTIDPLAFMEQYLRRRNLWSEEWQKKIAGDFAAELDAAFASFEQTSHVTEAPR